MRTAAPWLLYGLLSASLGLNLFMVLDRPAPDRRQLRKDQPAPAAAAAAITAVLAVPELPEEAEPVAVPVEIVEAAVAIPEPAGDWTVTQIILEHSLARSFSKAVGGHGDALSAVYARIFHWDIDLRRDLYKGDRIVVAWQLVDGVPEIAAARLQSGKLGRTLSGYRWTRPGDPFPGYWDKDGQARGRRLKQSPLDEYVQITGLLRDRPNHKGMDFKTPIGTPILATRAGTITRSNWNTVANGGCVEVQFSDGTLAKYLHLSGVSVRPGQRVAAGQVIGKTGNTGRTTAPHLHYQLNRGASVVDPVAFHGTTRRALNPGEMHAFQSDVARLDALLGNALARR